MCNPTHDCPICAPAAAIWAAAQAAANEPGTWTDADEAMSLIDPDPDDLLPHRYPRSIA